MSEPKVVFEAAPSRWVIEYQNPGQDWAFFERKPTLEAAKEYAQQAMDYASANSAALWRVVDTQPEEPHIPDEAVEAAWKVMEPLFLGMNRERCRDSLILAFRAALPHLVPDMSGEDFYVRPRQQHSKHVI